VGVVNGPSIADDLSLALSVVVDADLIAMGRFRSLDLRVDTKPDRSPVTDADRAVEQVIRERIAASRPGDAFLGEEYAATGTTGAAAAGRQWIVDPIDGTANFLRGLPTWGTLIALAIDGVPVVGVVSSPALGRRWWGARGHGAWAQDIQPGIDGVPEALTVSRVAGLGDAYFSHGAIQLWSGLGRAEQLTRIASKVWREHGYGDFWQHMLVAEGRIDAAAEFDVQPYDVAAVIPIIEEAGGRFSAVDGTPGPWAGSALTTNGALHEPLLAELAH